jgi:hypothetical protein
MTYVGTKEPGNLGELWQQFQDGLFRCINNPDKKFALPEYLIMEDVQKGYLKPHKDEKSNN